MRRGRLIAAAFGVLGITATVSVPAGATSAPTWTTQYQYAYTADNGGNVNLNSISATSGGDVWAAGYIYDGTNFLATALRRHAGVWAKVALPQVDSNPIEDLLYGVDAVAPNDVWMVGGSASSPTSLIQTPLVEHWNGTSVAIVSVPSPANTSGLGLVAISGPEDNLWTVGQGNFDTTAVEQYNGSAWQVIPFHVVAPGCTDARGAVLNAVVVTRAGSVYVGGYCPTAKGQIGIVEEYVSGKWVLSATTPNIGEINALSEAPDGSVWAVGTQQSAGGGAGWLRGIALHGSGTSFVSVDQPTPKAGAYDGFTGVSASGSSVVAVGTGTSPQPPFVGFGAYNLVGNKWETDNVINKFGGFGRLYAVTEDSSGQVLAAGFGITSSGSDTGLISVESGT